MAFRDNTRFKRNKDEDEERQYDTVFSSHKTTSRFRKSYNDAKRDGGLNTEDRERKISPYTHHESYNPYDMALETARNYTQPTTNNVTSANFYDDLTDKDKINLSESKYDLGVVPQALLQFPGGYSIPTMEALTPKKENLLSQREDLWNQETDKINDFYNNVSNIGQNEVKNPSEIDMDSFVNNVSNIGQSENKELDVDAWKEFVNNSGNQKDNGNWYEQLKDVDKALDTVNYYEDLNKYYSIPEAEDFEEYSKYTGASAFPTSEAQKVAKALNDGSFNAPLSEYKFATDDEVAVFNYLLNKEGEEAAMDFYNKLNLTGRRTQEYTNNVKEFLTRDDGALLNTGKRTLGGLLSIPLGIVGGAVGTTANIGSYLTGNDIDINSDSNLATNIAKAMREGSITGTVNDLDNWGVSEGISDFLNSAGQSLAASYGIQNKSALGAVTGNNDVADELIDASKDIEFTTPEGVSQKIGEGLDLLYSTVNSALNIVFAGHAATITMGLSAANDTIIDAKERGLTDGQAIALGTLAGAIEVATEKYSVEALLDGDVRGWQAIKQNFLTEASEEGASAFLNEAIDLAISGDKAQRRVLYEQYLKEGYSENEALAMTLGSTLMDIMKQSAAGGISGALMSGGMEAYRYINESSTGNKMLSNEEGINTFVNLGLQSENEQTRELAQSVADGNKKKNIIGQLVQAVSSENNVVGNIVDKLIGSGETVAMAEAEAKAIMKEFYKEDLTAKEREYINKENVQNVLNDLYSGTYDELNEKSVTADDAYSRALELAKQNKKNPVANVVNTVKGVFNKNATETTENATEIENNSQNEENNSQNEKSEEDNIRDAIRHMPLSQKGKAIAEADAYNKSIKQVNATLNDVKAVEVTPDGLSVTLNDGQKVNTHQIMDNATRKLLEVTERNFGDTQGAEDFIKAYKENTNLPVFVNAAYQMINAGSNGENITEAVNSVKNDASFRVNGKNIPVSFLNNMYAYGVREQARISEAMNSKKQRTLSGFVLNGLGLENYVKEGGIEEQGSYNESTNEITFGEKTGHSRVEILAHELTHMMKQHARETYNELEKVVLDSFKENGVYDKIFKNIKETYGEDSTKELIDEEIVASAMQEMLFNENVINELCKEKPNFARKIIAAIRKAIEELRNVFRGNIGTDESKMLSQDIEALEKAEKLYAKGLKEAAAYVKENGGKNTNENGTIKHAISPSEYANRSKIVNYDEYNLTPSEEKELWYKVFRDAYGNEIGHVKYNGEYYVYDNADIERADYEIIEKFKTKKEVEDYYERRRKEYGREAYHKSEDADRMFDEIEAAEGESSGYAFNTSDGRTDRRAVQMGKETSGTTDNGVEKGLGRSSNKNSSRERTVGPKKDNKGDRLSEGQREYFANVDSELKDSNGNLKRYYHGTETPGFSVFKPSNRKGFTDNYNAIYLTDNENVAKTYTKEKDGVYPLYVKAENPYVVDAKGQTFHNWKVDNYAKRYTDIQLEASSEGHRFAYWHEDGDRKRSYGDFTIEELVDKFGEKIGIFDFADDTHIGVIYLDENGNNIPTSTDDCILHAKNNGYDSVVFNNIRDMGRFAEDYETSQVVAVFNPNQVKDIYNLTPTESKTIHFSKKGKNNIKFSYAGINAIGADMASLTEAINMLEEGKSKEDVFRETGWFQGVDKKWRYEISDDAMKVFPKGDAKYLNDKEYQRYQELEKTFFNGDASNLSKEELKEFDDLYNKFLNRKSLRVDDVIQHDKLFEAYPFLRKIQIEFVKPETMNGASGRFNATEGKIYVDLYEKARLNDLKSTIIHELQHAIQNWSGYAGGASAEMYAGINSVIDSYYYEEYKDSDTAIKRLLNKAPEEFKEKYNKISESYLMYRTTQDEKYINEAHKLEEDLEANYKKLYDDLSELEAEKKFYEDLLEEEITPEKLYWITAGEIEARDAESRINLTEEERREKYPKRTEKHKVYIKETGEYFDDRGIRYSKKDNHGRQLSEEQIEYFKDSKVRDAEGNLQVLYHQTDNDFTIFDTRRAGAGQHDYLTPYGVFLKPNSNNIGLKGNKQMELYANITNMLNVSSRYELENYLKKDADLKDAIDSMKTIDAEYQAKFDEAKNAWSNYIVENSKQGKDLRNDPELERLMDEEEKIVEAWGKEYDKRAEKVKANVDEYLRSQGYDGVHILKDEGSFGRKVETFIAFEPNQVKDVNNLNPTKNEDIRYSLQDDWDFDWEAAMAESEEEKIAEGMVAQNDVNILEDGFRALKDIKDAGKVNISHNKAVQIAKRYTEKYDSATGAESLATSIEAVFAYIREHDVSYDDMLRVMRDVTLPVVENIRGDEQFTEEYRDFVKSLKGTSISLNESQKKEVAYAYGSMANFRKAVAGRFNIKEDGVNIDSLWPEIVEQSGYRLDEEENSNSQPIALLELLDQMKSDKGTVNRGMSDNQLALDMALNIYTDCFKEMSMNAAKVNETEVARRLAKTKEILTNSVKKYEEAVDKMYKKMLADTKAQAQAEIDRLNQELSELNNIDTYNRSIDIDKRIVQLNRQKERLKKEIEEGKVRRQTSRQKARENRENSRMRNAIKSIVKDLSSRLANPTKNKYIPEKLVKTTVDMLECINFDTKEGDNIKEKVKKVKDAYEKLGKSTNENDASDDYDPALYNMITRLKEIFDDGKEGKSVRKLSQKELEDVLTIAKAIQIQVKHANELIRSEIAQQLDETAKGVIDDVRATSKIGNKKFQHWLNSYVNTQLNASRFFNRLVGYDEDSKMIKLFDELNEGQHKMMQIQMETSDIFKDIIADDDEARKITGENEKDWVETPFKDKNGNSIKISKGMRLSLAMHMENEDNLKHIIYGGLTVPDMKLYNQGRRAEAYESSETEIRLIDDKTRLKLFELRDEANKLNDEKYTNQEREEAWEKYKDVVKRAETEARQKLQSIVNGMTDYEKQFLEYAKKYFWEYSGKQINETSMALNGYPKAMVENYFPIATDKNYTKRDIEGLKLDQTLESWGNLKERVHGRNPIYLENILDVITKHSNMVSKYAGLAIPIRNFNRVYNFSLKENGAYKDSVKKAINSQRGISATKYIENLLTDLQGSRKVDTGIAGDLLSFFRGSYASAALTMNYGVTIKQASSLPTAAAVIGKDAIKHAIFSRQGASLGRTIVLPFWMSKTTKNKMDLIKKYSPLVWYRNQGNSTQELGDLKKQRTLLDITKPTRKFKELTSNWIQNVDTTTVVTLWDAAEYRVSKDNPELKKGSEEYYKEVAKWFNKTVEDTQPNYTTLQRPDILRNPNEIVKGLNMFKTQSYQNGGLITDSFGNMMAKEINYKNNRTAENKAKLKKAQKRFANTVAAIFTAQMLFSVMGFIAYCVIHKPDRYRDENGELTAESITKGIMRDFGSAISGSFMFGSEVYDGLSAIFSGGKYYGLELASVDQISTFIKDGINLASSGNDIDKIQKNALKLINDVSYLSGVPLKNATNLINGVKLHAQDIINGNPLSFDAGYQRTNKQNATLLYNALESGDQDEFDKVYNRMLGEGYSEEDMYNKQGNNNDAGDIVTTKYKEGDIDFDTAVKYYTELGMNEDDAYFKTVKMTTDFQSPYALCVSAISSEDTGAIIDAVNGMLDHGYTKDKLKGYDMPDSIKEQYIDLYNTNKTEAASLKSAILTYYQACGMSREDAAKKVDKWVE